MPMLPDEIPEATLRLVLTRGIGPVTLRRLRDRFTDDEAIVGASVRDLRSITGIGPRRARALNDADRFRPRVARNPCGLQAGASSSIATRIRC